MVHNRFNEREAHPNKHINFITALPMPSVPTPYSEEDARQLLRALAAQVRPIMKSHGFSVNSFEEYEYNHVFAGRNWNNGETIELVLRRADGMFVSIPWLLSTLCHELAHIKHMNHGRDFQKLWAQLRMELRALQEKGYYGDGYWSSGTRIADSARVGGQGIEDIDLPDYVCGGAQTRSRPKSLGRRRRVQRRIAGPSKHTGAQTEKRRKPGTRVTAKGKFIGEGQALNADISDEDMKTKGTGFRKQAGSKRAREERALAAERRLKVIQATSEKLQDHPPDEDSVTEDDSEYDERDCEPAETDEHRRQIMRDSMKDDSDGLNSSRQFMKDFLAESALEKNSIKEPKNPRKYASVIDAIESSEDEDACNLHSTSYSITSRSPKRQEGEERPSKRTRVRSPSPIAGPSRASQKSATSLGLGRLAQEEMASRRKESLGMTGGRKLGSGSGAGSAPASSFPSRKAFDASISAVAVKSNDKRDWACHVCTLENLPNHLACSACGTPRGESTWVGQHE